MLVMCWSRIVLQEQCDLRDNEDQIGSSERKRELKGLRTPWEAEKVSPGEADSCD